MLVLSRKLNERIMIGDSIEIKVLKISHGRVKLGIEADSFIDIRRAEIDIDSSEVEEQQSTKKTQSVTLQVAS